MSSAAGAGELPANAQVLQMIAGKWVSRAISVAAELAIADLLAGGERSTADLAAESGAHEPSLYRLLRALASLGIFAETGNRRFGLTPLAQCLRSDVPDSVRNTARFAGMPVMWRAWEELLHSVKTGETGIKKAYGLDDAFTYLKDHSDEAAIFDAAMSDYSRQSAPAIADAYDFGRFGKVVDIAGGHGVLLSTILNRYPSVHGVLFDLPHVIEGARPKLAAAGLGERCEAVSGDFFQEVPAGGDVYLMKHIIHDWDDERAVAIMRNCRKGIAPGGRLLLAEFAITAGNDPSFGKLLDLEMLAVPGGKERTESEFADLYAAAGFRLMAVHPTQAPIHIIEGVVA